jgi:membrane protein
MTSAGKVRSILWRSLGRWAEHRAPTRSAAIAFYSLTSIAPLSVLLVWIGAAAWERASFRAMVLGALTRSVGPEASRLVESIVTEATLPGGEALLPSAIAVLVFVFSATAVLSQVQGALRDIWEAPPLAESEVVGFLRRKLVALSFIGAVGFLLLLSMGARVAVSAMTERFQSTLPIPLLVDLEPLLSLITLIAVFMVVFRILPAVRVSWREAALGGAVTATLHVAGQWPVGWYLGGAALESAYGAAASLVVFMSWVYYSALVFLYGAEVTRALALAEPTEGGRSP